MAAKTPEQIQEEYNFLVTRILAPREPYSTPMWYGTAADAMLAYVFIGREIEESEAPSSQHEINLCDKMMTRVPEHLVSAFNEVLVIYKERLAIKEEERMRDNRRRIVSY